MNGVVTAFQDRKIVRWRKALFPIALIASGLVLSETFPAGAAPEFEVMQSFEYTSTNILTLVDFPQNNVPVVVGGTLYGTTMAQGLGYGTVFSITTNSTDFKILHEFSPEPLPVASNYDGAFPFGSLVVTNGLVYGVTLNGGVHTFGTLFAVDTNGDDFLKLYDFTNGTPCGLALYDGYFYGTFWGGGGQSVWKISTAGTDFEVIHNFTNLVQPYGTNNDGYSPWNPLLAADGRLYGVTYQGGPQTNGTIFALDTDGGNFQVLHSFGAPYAGLATSGLLLVGGTLYGTEPGGSENSGGTIFSLATNGNNFQTLYDFTTNTALYLYRIGGGSPTGLTFTSNLLFGCVGRVDGFIFSIGTNGDNFLIQQSFFSEDVNIEQGLTTNVDGRWPYFTPVADGDAVYGITESGGLEGAGTAYALRSPYYTVNTLPGPTVKITSPLTNQVINGTSFVATGTTSDPFGVASLTCQLTMGSQPTLGSTNAGLNWTANLALAPGSNVLTAIVESVSGLYATNSVAFDVVPALEFSNVLVGSQKVVFSGTGGTMGQNYTILGATNLSLAISNWTPLATNVFLTNGFFIATNSLTPSSPRYYYLLKVP